MEIVSYTPFGMYIPGTSGILLDLFPEPSHMYINRTCIALIIVLPDYLEEHFPAVHLIGIKNKELKDVEFTGRQIDLNITYKNSSALNIEFKTRSLKGFFDMLLRASLSVAPDDRLYTRFNFQNVKGLCDIIIGTVFKTIILSISSDLAVSMIMGTSDFSLSF